MGARPMNGLVWLDWIQWLTPLTCVGIAFMWGWVCWVLPVKKASREIVHSPSYSAKAHRLLIWIPVLICAGMPILFLAVALQDPPFEDSDFSRIFMGVGVTIAAAGVSFRCDVVMRRRLRENLATPRCYSCGYDLRGSLADDCPECGTTIPTSRKNQRSKLLP